MAKDKKSSTVVVSMTQDKVCKSCVRFAAAGEDAKLIQNVYVQNAALEALDSPEEIKITITKA
jgi:hypothetical protein